MPDLPNPAPAAGSPPAPAPAPGTPSGGAGAAPAGGPMSTPQPKAGLEQAGRVSVEIAVKQIEDAMGKFPIDSDEKKALNNAHSALIKAFGKGREKASELIPAELSQLAQSMPGMMGGAGAAPGGGMPPKPAVPGMA